MQAFGYLQDVSLTISPPWVFAIFHLGKDCENRVWTPSPSELRPGEWLLVHGGRSPLTSKGNVQNTAYGQAFQAAVVQLVTDINSKTLILTPEQTAYLRTLGTKLEGGGYKFDLSKFHMPGIVGAVEFLGWQSEHKSYWAVKGQYQWVLGRKVLFPEAIQCRGALGLWDVPSEVHQQARELYKQAMAGAQ